MKVNFNQSFKDFKGNEVKVNGKTVMISDEVGKILFNMGTSGNSPMSADEKYMAYKLCNRISQTGDVDITSEESVFILKACSESLTAGAYGQIRDLIENN